MNTFKQNKEETPFHVLNPATIIQLAEQYLSISFTNIFRPLNSYINRVYELATEEGEGVIIKFYRPSRWTRKAIEEEHLYLQDLYQKDIPVISPMEMANGSTLGEYNNISFALFPKCGGRSVDEFTEEQWLELGRLLGRTHLVGSMRKASARIYLAPEKSTHAHIQFILENDLLPVELQESFRQITGDILELITNRFQNIEYIRIHGDCHFSNIIYRPDESFYLIDFDDMAMGPPVQDIWMLLPGYVNDAMAEIELLLEGYETFHEFDRRTLQLVEPLRAMRYLHYMAWCGQQVKEDGKTAAVADFGTLTYWQTEIIELKDQLERIKKTTVNLGNC